MGGFKCFILVILVVSSSMANALSPNCYLTCRSGKAHKAVSLINSLGFPTFLLSSQGEDFKKCLFCPISSTKNYLCTILKGMRVPYVEVSEGTEAEDLPDSIRQFARQFEGESMLAGSQHMGQIIDVVIPNCLQKAEGMLAKAGSSGNREKALSLKGEVRSLKRNEKYLKVLAGRRVQESSENSLEDEFNDEVYGEEQDDQKESFMDDYEGMDLGPQEGLFAGRDMKRSHPYQSSNPRRGGQSPFEAYDEEEDDDADEFMDEDEMDEMGVMDPYRRKHKFQRAPLPQKKRGFFSKLFGLGSKKAASRPPQRGPQRPMADPYGADDAYDGTDPYDMEGYSEPLYY